MKDNNDQQLYVKVTLRELILYSIFMFVIVYRESNLELANPKIFNLILYIFRNLCPILAHVQHLHEHDEVLVQEADGRNQHAAFLAVHGG